MIIKNLEVNEGNLVRIITNNNSEYVGFIYETKFPNPKKIIGDFVLTILKRESTIEMLRKFEHSGYPFKEKWIKEISILED